MNEPFTVDQLPDRTVDCQGKQYRFFSGTAYLGLPQHPAFQQLLFEGICRYGTAFGSSRNGNVQLSIYAEAESKLACWVGALAALTVSSGMMAGQVVSNWLRAQHITCIYAPNTHPALWHEPTLALPTDSFADWVAQLPNQLETVAPGPVAILTNSLDAVRSQQYDFDWLSALPVSRPIIFIVDDSHGLGVLNDGRGIWPQIPQKSGIQTLVTASLAKAMGMPGGVIFSDPDTHDNLRRTAFFGACSPMPPAYLDAYVRADALIADQQERLWQLIQLAEKLLLPTGLFQHTEGYPVFFTERDDLYPFLLQRGTLIYSFSYPTTAARANTRIVISAFHELADIEQLAEQVHAYQRVG